MLLLYVGLMGVQEITKRFLFHGVGGLDAISTVTDKIVGLGGFGSAASSASGTFMEALYPIFSVLIIIGERLPVEEKYF